MISQLTLPVISTGPRCGAFIHPMASLAQLPTAKSVSLWVGVRDADGEMSFLRTNRIDPSRIQFDFAEISTGTLLVIGATIDKNYPATKKVFKCLAAVETITTLNNLVEKLFLSVECSSEVRDIIASKNTATITTAPSAPELVDHDEAEPAPTPTKIPASILSETQTVFARLASTVTLMDNTHLPVKVAADVTNCPDFADFQRALDAAGFTLRFAPKDTAAANLAAMSEADVVALLKRIPSDTLARELTKRGMEVIG